MVSPDGVWHTQAEESEEDLYSPYDKMLFMTLDFMGLDQESIEGFMQEHQLGARIAADSLSGARVVMGMRIMNKFDDAVEEGNSKLALGMTGAMVALLATDFIDGFIARTARIHDSTHGKYMDAGSDVILRGRIAKSLKPYLERKGNAEKLLQLARVTGDAIVGLNTAPDFLHGTYETTQMGKWKVNADAAFVLGTMIEMSTGKSMQAIAMPGLLGATALAWKDGFDRAREKYRKFDRATKVKWVL